MKKTFAAVASMLLLAGACKEPLAAPTEDNLVAGGAIPVQNLVTGVLASDRSITSSFSYLLYPESMARNALRPDPNEPRYIADIISTTADPSAFIGSARTASIELSGRNLVTWTKYGGIDPEVSNFGNAPLNRLWDLAPYPPSRQFFFSLNATF